VVANPPECDQHEHDRIDKLAYHSGRVVPQPEHLSSGDPFPEFKRPDIVTLGQCEGDDTRRGETQGAAKNNGIGAVHIGKTTCRGKYRCQGGNSQDQQQYGHGGADKRSDGFAAPDFRHNIRYQKGNRNEKDPH